MKNLVIDLDGTLTIDSNVEYRDKLPNVDIIEQLKQYKKNGFNITILTSRNMRTYKGNIGKINVHTLPTILEWLDKHNVPYDDVVVGKPWCGFDGFYIDDKSIRPSEFTSMTYKEIQQMLKEENEYRDGGNK